MSFELSVNLEYMFNEAGERIEDRIAAASAAGFDKVEIFSTENRDLDSIARALANNGVSLWTVVADPRIRIIDPQTHETFRQTIEQARPRPPAWRSGQYSAAERPLRRAPHGPPPRRAD